MTLWLGLLVAAQFQPAVHAQTPNRAALVVSYAEGVNAMACVSFDEPTIKGIDLLRRSGLVVQTEVSGQGEAICRIDDTGCPFPEQKCFCQCLPGASSCMYWSYWRLDSGTWNYSQMGASRTEVLPGSVDGWVWGPGTIGQNASRQPPQVTFEQACEPTPTPTTPPIATLPPSATNTPTREPSTETPTPIPSQTFTPTPGPTPTETPTPFVAPAIRVFAADRAAILFGENATLAWDVAGSTHVLLRYPGGEEVVQPQGVRFVTPEMTTQYSLVATSPVGQAESVFTIEVNPVISAPTAELAAVPEIAQEIPTDTLVPPEATPTWTSTAAAMPTETPLPTETSTETPAPVEPPSEPPALAAAPEAVEAPVEAPPVITVVVTPVPELANAPAVADSSSESAIAPAVVLLEPGARTGASPASDAGSGAVTGAERAFMVSGLAFVVLTPLLFAGIWAAVWLVWRRR